MELETQEQATRKMFIMAVKKCKTNERRTEHAKGFKKVAGHVSKGKRAGKSFLKARVGQYGGVELPKGRVRVAQQDGGTVIWVAWMTTAELSMTDVRVFIEKVFGEALTLNEKYKRHCWVRLFPGAEFWIMVPGCAFTLSAVYCRAKCPPAWTRSVLDHFWVLSPISLKHVHALRVRDVWEAVFVCVPGGCPNAPLRLARRAHCLPNCPWRR